MSRHSTVFVMFGGTVVARRQTALLPVVCYSSARHEKVKVAWDARTIAS